MWILVGMGIWIGMLLLFDWLHHKGIGTPRTMEGGGWKDETNE